MTHEELEAIRLRAAEAARYRAPYGPEHSAYVRQHPDSYPSTNSAIDVPALLAYVDELHGVVHDLRQDATGEAWGRRAGIRAVTDVLQALCREFHRTANIQATAGYSAAADAYRCAAQKVTAGFDAIVRYAPEVAPHLAPDDLRRENEALRAALTAVVDAEREPMMLERLHRLEAAIVAARRLLGDM